MEEKARQLQAEIIVKAPIRRIALVVDMKDPLSPELSLDHFRELFGKDPDPDRYRLLNLEVITSPDDQQPMLVTECGKYSSFVRRDGQNVYFKKNL